MLCLECSHPVKAEDRSCPNCGSRIPETVRQESTVAEGGAPTRATNGPLEFTPGASFAERFTIIDKIGQGGMGVVYKAMDRTLDEVVALKLIRPELASITELVERFKREVRLTRQITHPNVCRVHDIGAYEGVFFLSMEWIQGETLRRLLNQTGQLDKSRALLIAEKIAHALEAVHAKGVIHRDLKPGNVMIDSRGEVFVMDFGLARERDSELSAGAGHPLGTPFYMAPEQRRGEEPDARTDLYALGLILREMLTGRRYEPEAGEPGGPRAGMNGRIGALVRKLLAEDPDDRPESAAEVATTLKVLRRGSTVGGRIREWVRRHPQRTLVLSTAATLAVASVGLYFFVHRHDMSSVFSPSEADASVWYDRGMLYLREEAESLESLDTAIQMFNRSLQADSSFVQSWAALGEAYWMRFERRNDPPSREEAELALNRAGSLAPDLPEVRNARGRGYIVQGKFEEAKRQLESAVSADPDFDVAWENLGRANQELGDYDAGLFDLQRAVQLRRGRFRHHVALGNFYKHFGERAEAIDSYRRAIDLKPNSRMAWNNLGIVYSQSNRFQDAVEAFTRALELEDRPESRSNLATAYYYLGRLEEARVNYQKAVAMEPGNATYQGNLGDVLVELGRTEDAQKAYREAVRLAKQSTLASPDDPGSQMQLGLWCARLGDADSALAAGNRAAQLQPDSVQIMYVNAMIRCLLGMESEALDWLERAARIGLGRALIEGDPCLRGLSGDPRYTRILQLTS